MAVIARRCAWCGEWDTPHDERAANLGFPVTHRMCDDCVERFLDEMEQAAVEERQTETTT